KGPTPLVRGDQQLVPNPAGVFFADENLFLRSEVYGGGSDTSRIVASLRLLNGTTIAYDSGPLSPTYVAETRAVVIERSIPNSQPQAGAYVCQLTVVDESLGVFALARLSLRIKADPHGVELNSPTSWLHLGLMAHGSIRDHEAHNPSSPGLPMNELCHPFAACQLPRRECGKNLNTEEERQCDREQQLRRCVYLSWAQCLEERWQTTPTSSALAWGRTWRRMGTSSAPSKLPASVTT